MRLPRRLRAPSVAGTNLPVFGVWDGAAERARHLEDVCDRFGHSWRWRWWLHETGSGGQLARYRPLTTGLSIYLAARDDGAISRSTSGITYTAIATGATTPLRGVAYANGWFVAVGDGGRAIRTADLGSVDG